MEPSFTVTKVSNTHLMNTKQSANPTKYKFLCLWKGTPIDDSPMESFQGILKKETLYNNSITSIEENQVQVEDWIEFYNTKRLKNRKKSKISS